MNIGIFIHTQSGATAHVARSLAAAFRKRGDCADVRTLRTEGVVRPRQTSFEIKSPPQVDDCDLLIFGAPVWAFTASPVILKYIENLSTGGKLSGKKAACLVTKGLPFGWTGGKQALGAMNKRLKAAGAQVLAAEMFFAMKLRNEKAVQQTVDRIVAACSE